MELGKNTFKPSFLFLQFFKGYNSLRQGKSQRFQTHARTRKKKLLQKTRRSNPKREIRKQLPKKYLLLNLMAKKKAHYTGVKYKLDEG